MDGAETELGGCMQTKAPERQRQCGDFLISPLKVTTSWTPAVQPRTPCSAHTLVWEIRASGRWVYGSY